MLNEHRFDEAAALAGRALREATADSPERLTQAAREIVAWRGMFAQATEEAASETYFRSVHRTLAELAGPDSPAAMAAAENLAGILGALGQIDEAIALREKVYDHARNRFPADDARVMQLRDGLAFLYRRAGHESKAAVLFADVGLCEHLAPAERYILGQGAKVVSCGRPWSQNCHIWVYFDALLDCERLIAGLQLDPCVAIHDHRGTQEGSERGLVCTIHHDALMGPHPSDAPPQTRTVA